MISLPHDVRFTTAWCIITIACVVLFAGRVETVLAQEYSEPPVQADSVGFIHRELSYARGRVGVSIGYPELAALRPSMRRALNRVVRDHARDQFREYCEMLIGSSSELRDVAGFSATRDYRVWILDSNVISVLYSWDVYSGGAHPGGFYESDVYLTDNGIRTLTLRELFRPESGYDSVLADLIARNVLSRDPDGVWANGEELRTSLVEYGPGSFALTRDGILFATWPGPHVAGPIEVLVPYGAVAAYIDPRGPIGRFSSANSSR